MNIETIHERFVKGRRVTVLNDLLQQHFPEGPATVLDVGCGDGALAKLLMTRRSELDIVGIDPLVRDETAIPVTLFDGEKISYDDRSFDYCLFVDVLHHADDPNILLREAARVARRGVVIKDHFVRGMAARQTLRFMDDTHNRRYGVSLPYNYWTPGQWQRGFDEAGLEVAQIDVRLKLYPAWANWLFGRGLHFVARLGISED